MKNNLILLSAVVGAALLFVVVFYKQSIGLNLLLFESIIIGSLFYFKRITADRELIITLAAVIATAVVVVIHNTALSVVVNILSLVLLTGKMLYPKGGSLLYALGFAGPHLFRSQLEFLKTLGSLSDKRPQLRLALKWFRILLISTIVVVAFVALYNAANPIFSDLISGLTSGIDWFFKQIFSFIEFGIILTFLLGLLICDFLILKTSHPRLENEVDSLKELLIRKKDSLGTKTISLEFKREWKAAFVLLSILNLLLLIVNSIDIYWVWFNFKWNGDYLKQFVHEGTYMLIFSILISVAVSLYIFRGNLNFFSKNKSIKIMTYIWLSQNVVLAISVGIRNFHYIQYYALAYRRIGVIFFLIATIIGLISVMMKIKHLRSMHFLLRTNALSVFLLLIIMSIVNWDIVIARYNFNHAHRSFVHFDFMSELSNNALPYLRKDLEQLKEIEQANARFPSKIEYMPAEHYKELIDERIIHFTSEFEKEHWLSWNYSSQRAYNKLSKVEVQTSH
jgi:hypothetical protein